MNTPSPRPALKERGNDRRLWKALVKAAQDSYREHAHPSYGLTDEHMEAAIRAALAKYVELER